LVPEVPDTQEVESAPLRKTMKLGLLNFPLDDHAKSAGSARLNAQRAGEEVRTPLNRHGLLGSPQSITSGSPDFIQQLLQFLRTRHIGSNPVSGGLLFLKPES
jgi:hypothetical protein